jgi:hypothetical protein
MMMKTAPHVTPKDYGSFWYKLSKLKSASLWPDRFALDTPFTDHEWQNILEIMRHKPPISHRAAAAPPPQPEKLQPNLSHRAHPPLTESQTTHSRLLSHQTNSLPTAQALPLTGTV